MNENNKSFYVWFYSYAIDTAALLGGNEYLIKQMLDEIEQLEYNEKELSVLKWALTEVNEDWFKI